jgi:hypothetical protein
MNQWFLMVSPTYHFTTNGFCRHPHPAALLSGKKRLENNASIRGQVIMWHRFLTQHEQRGSGLFAEEDAGPAMMIRFQPPPEVDLPTTVPDDVWGRPKKVQSEQDDGNTTGLLFDEV